MTTVSPVHRKLSIRVTHINHPSSFYAQIGPADELRSFDRFASELDDWAKGCSVSCTVFPDVGTYLLVKYSTTKERETDLWTRAFVTEKLNAGIKVFLIDFGKMQCIFDVREVCGGYPPMLLSMAQQALHCRLVDTQLNTDWSESAIERFKGCVFGEEKELLCTVYPQINGKWPVAVFHRENDIWCSVGSVLGKFECSLPPSLLEELAELNKTPFSSLPVQHDICTADEEDKASICTQHSLSEYSEEDASDFKIEKEQTSGVDDNEESASKEIVTGIKDDSQEGYSQASKDRDQAQKADAVPVQNDHQDIPSHDNADWLEDLTSDSDDANEWDDTLLVRPQTPPLTPPSFSPKKITRDKLAKSEDSKQSSTDITRNSAYKHSTDGSLFKKSSSLVSKELLDSSNKAMRCYSPSFESGGCHSDQSSPRKSLDNLGSGFGRKQWKRKDGLPPLVKRAQRPGYCHSGFGRGGGFMKTKPPFSERTPHSDQSTAHQFSTVSVSNQIVKRPPGTLLAPPTPMPLSSPQPPKFGFLSEGALKNEADWLAFKIESEVKKVLTSATDSSPILISNLTSIMNGATVEKLRMLKADARPVGIVVKVLLNWAISKLSISNHTVLAIHALYVGHQEEMSVCLVEVFKEVFKNNCEAYSGNDTMERRQMFCGLLGNLLLCGLSLETTSFVNSVVECVCSLLSNWTNCLSQKNTSTSYGKDSSSIYVYYICALCESVGPSMDTKNREILDGYFATVIPDIITGDVLKQSLKLNLLNLLRRREQWLTSHLINDFGEAFGPTLPSLPLLNPNNTGSDTAISEPSYKKVSSMLGCLGLNELLDKFKSAKIQDSLLLAEKHELKEVLKDTGIPPGAILSILKYNYNCSGYPTNAGDKPVSTSPPQPIKSQVLSPPLQGKGALPNSIPDHPRMFQQRDPSNLTPGTPVTPFYMNRNLTGDQLSVSHSFESNENLAPSEGLKTSVVQPGFRRDKMFCLMCGVPDHRGYLCPRRRELVFAPSEAH